MNMKINKFHILLIASLCTQMAFSQSSGSYSDMENRFTKSTLTKADSLAFKEAGVLKAKSLFEYGEVYRSNSSNSSNQAYVIQRVPSLFFIPESDTLNTLDVMNHINTIIKNEKPKPVEIIFTEKEGVLGHVSTDLKKLNFAADIILLKVPKNFGDSEEEIWQVFLSSPVFW